MLELGDASYGKYILKTPFQTKNQTKPKKSMSRQSSFPLQSPLPGSFDSRAHSQKGTKPQTYSANLDFVRFRACGRRVLLPCLQILIFRIPWGREGKAEQPHP